MGYSWMGMAEWRMRETGMEGETTWDRWWEEIGRWDEDEEEGTWSGAVKADRNRTPVDMWEDLIHLHMS